MSSQNASFPAHVLSVHHRNTTSTPIVQSEYYISSQWLVSTPSPMSSQNTTSPAHIKSVHHLDCPCLVRIPYLLPMFYKYTVSPAKSQFIHHLSCLCPFRISCLMPMMHSLFLSPFSIGFFKSTCLFFSFFQQYMCHLWLSLHFCCHILSFLW